MGEGEYLCNNVFTDNTDELYATLLIKEYIQNAPYTTTKKLMEIKWT